MADFIGLIICTSLVVASDLGIVMQLLRNAIIRMMLILLILIMSAAVNILYAPVEAQTSKNYHVVKIPGVMLFPGRLLVTVLEVPSLLVRLGDCGLAVKLWV